MRKITLFILAAFLLTAQGCSDFVSKDDVNPNVASKSALKTLLPVAELTVFATYNGQMARSSSMYIQHITGVSNQMYAINRYILTETDVDNDWVTLYTSGVGNAKQLIADAGTANPHYSGIGKVMLAMMYGIATDYWGDIPTTEAGLGLATLNPKHESQEQVLNQIQTLLSEAITELQQPTANNTFLPDGDDYIHGGSAAKWIKTAWILKARYANRLSKRSSAASATSALEYITNAQLVGNSDDANANYNNSVTSSKNIWAGFEKERPDYIKVSNTMIDKLISLNDPRLAAYATALDGGTYVGAPAGTQAINFCAVGSALLGNQLPLVTYVEAKFIEAEAALRKGNTAQAQAAFTDAVTKDLQRYSAADTTVTRYITQYGTLSSTSSQALEQIMTQKWIAMYGQPEAWSDWRRTNLPTLTPNPSGTISQIPRRYPTAQSEKIYNTSGFTVVSNLTTPVWWDAQ